MINQNVLKKIFIVSISSVLVISIIYIFMTLLFFASYGNNGAPWIDLMATIIFFTFIGLVPSILTVLILEFRGQKNPKVYTKGCILFAFIWVVLLLIWFDFVLPFFWKLQIAVENGNNFYNISGNPEPLITIKRSFFTILMYSILFNFGFCKLYCYLIKKLKIRND